ncbi:MAG: methylmalonyl Co-A mutase-associated GTPase MeaB [Oligoflexales bacterium]|nr:methylmalonyl Co-A mutase-associated GTPase MeaB [Oligoflexales bacterium]
MQDYDVPVLMEGILKGDRRALARSITLVESEQAAHQEAKEKLLKQVLPHSGKALRLGISGIPGVGKSTLIEKLGAEVLADPLAKLAVLSVDPSSPLTGGSLLGDKLRMQSLALHPRAFIRPSPQRVSHGGLAKKSRETLLLMEAAGFNRILVETVGTGQSEYTVASMVDCFLLLMMPATGDEWQSLKRGALELSDFIFINKADGELKIEALKAKQIFETAVSLRLQGSMRKSPQGVLLGSALFGEGIKELWSELHTFFECEERTQRTAARRKEQNTEWFCTELEEALQFELKHSQRFQDELEKMKNLCLDKPRSISPTWTEVPSTVARTIAKTWLQGGARENCAAGSPKKN